MNTGTTSVKTAELPEIEIPGGLLRPGARIPCLDFLRAISAAIVVIYHSGYQTIPAGFGVLTFFVISGFLITHLMIREKEATGTISFRDFYIRRSLRIFPAFYVYWIIAIAVLTLRHAKIIWPQAICSFFYVNNYYQGLHNYPASPFSHTWSLGVEEQFYLLWPGAFLLFRNRLPLLARTLLFLIPALWIYRALLHIYGISDPYIYTSFETRVDAILVGCLFALLLHLGFAPRLMAKLSSSRYLLPTIGALLLSIYCGGGNAYRDIVGFAIDPLLVMLLILQLIRSRHVEWMESRPFTYLGNISYSTYLYQQLVIPTIVFGLHISFQPMVTVLCLVATWLIASASFELVEKRFLLLKRRFTARAVLADS